MTFEITSITGFPPAEREEFKQFIQWQGGGVDAGAPNVRVVNFVGENIRATRGTGENANVITVEIIPPVPPPADLQIAWSTPIADAGGAIAANAEGTRDDYDAPDFHILYAGVVDYADQVVVWTPTWDPFFGDPAPAVTPQPGGKVLIEWFATGGPFDRYVAPGILTLTATIDGTSAETPLNANVHIQSYAALSWRTAEPAQSLGWHTDIYDVNDLGVHSNAGSDVYPAFGNFLYCGVIDYDVETEPTVVWSPVWVPFASDPAPDFGEAGLGQIGVVTLVGPTLPRGTLTISATVGGVPTDSVQLVIGADNAYTWGPVP